MARSDGTEVTVRNLRVYISGRPILKGINLRATPGSILAIMGPSGSGKSTLIRVINRLIDLNPSATVEGEVYIGGLNVLSADPYDVRRLTAMVFQEPNPFPHLSIFDNVAIGPKLHGLAKSRADLEEIVRWALEKSQLWEEVKDRLADYPHQLSGGQRQRLSLARALALKPKVLLLDEPTANIDPVSTRKIEESLREIARDLMTTVIIVTHTPQQAARIADYIAVLYNGELVEYGPAREVILYPKNEFTKKILEGVI
ncbi:MAG: phosphate ABC transporter ATP-binding protein [Aeropyrum sp.]|nr:phosphate ABC transporter ATP-binding protein [Aeropyrum sp.]MCE4615866.1 phosphate ABC transporter ATP-binding protein [Aeropyrum sp.]